MRFVSFFRSDDRTFRRFWRYVILSQEVDTRLQGPEYTGLIVEDPEEYEVHKLGRASDDSPISPTEDETEQWANEVHRHRHLRHASLASERTLFGNQRFNSSDTLNEAAKEKVTLRTRLLKAGQFAFTVLERSIVVAGFGQLLTGIVVYTGE